MYTYSVRCVKTMCVIYRRDGERATARRRLGPSRPVLARGTRRRRDARRPIAMAFILGGFSHLFAFKGAFQAEVRPTTDDDDDARDGWVDGRDDARGRGD